MNLAVLSGIPTCELHVFVHGSYAPIFSFLSYAHVKNDNLKGTAYLAVQRLMQNNDTAGYRRFCSKLGFNEVVPAKQLSLNDPARYVIGAHDAMRREVAPHDPNEHRYFLHGWHGLLSQHERRREAIYLYNELAALAAQVKAAGKKPLIKLYCHSHGCNVGLNLALVDACAFDAKSLPPYVELGVVTDMNNLLKGDALVGLEDILGVPRAEALSRYYCKPAIRLEHIDYLVMLSLPVQPETAPLVGSSLFGNVLQIYSENDGIVSRDPVSSRRMSTDLIDPKILQGHPKVKVIRWMHNRTSLDYCVGCDAHGGNGGKKSSIGHFKSLSPTRMNRLRKGGGNPDSHHPEDPTHNDFWSLGNKRGGLFFEQVPLHVFTPLMLTLLPAAGQAQYLDFCLIGDDARAKAVLVDSTNAETPHLCGVGEVSLKPIIKAREGIAHVLNARRRLQINIKIKSGF